MSPRNKIFSLLEMEWKAINTYNRQVSIINSHVVTYNIHPSLTLLREKL